MQSPSVWPNSLRSCCHDHELRGDGRGSCRFDGLRDFRPKTCSQSCSGSARPQQRQQQRLAPPSFCKQKEYCILVLLQQRKRAYGAHCPPLNTPIALPKSRLIDKKLYAASTCHKCIGPLCPFRNRIKKCCYLLVYFSCCGW